MTDDWIEIGKIGIDAGLVWIGDPCYLRADAHNNPLADWGESIPSAGAALPRQARGRTACCLYSRRRREPVKTVLEQPKTC